MNKKHQSAGTNMWTWFFNENAQQHLDKTRLQTKTIPSRIRSAKISEKPITHLPKHAQIEFLQRFFCSQWISRNPMRCREDRIENRFSLFLLPDGKQNGGKLDPHSFIIQLPRSSPSSSSSSPLSTGSEWTRHVTGCVMWVGHASRRRSPQCVSVTSCNVKKNPVHHGTPLVVFNRAAIALDLTHFPPVARKPGRHRYSNR